MGKTEFIGVRIESPLAQSIDQLIKTKDDYKNITQFVTKSLTREITEAQTNEQVVMGHPDYPELIRLVGSVTSKETQQFLYGRLENIKFNEVTSVYSWLQRMNGTN